VPVLSSKDRFASNRRESLFESVPCFAAKAKRAPPADKKLLKFAYSPVTQDKCVNKSLSARPDKRNKYVHEIVSAKNAETIPIVLKAQKMTSNLLNPVKLPHI
jgi:hypothetical protein